MRLTILFAALALSSGARAGDSPPPWWGLLLPLAPGNADRMDGAVGASAPQAASAPNSPPTASANCPPLASSPDAIRRIIEAEAARQRVDAKLAVAIARQESRLGLDLNSPAGARGVMQLMPATATRYAVRDPCDVPDNIRAGVSYIRDLTALYRGNVLLVLAGYNAGEAKVKAAGGVPPIAETVRYVAAGVNAYYGLSAIAKGRAGAEPEITAGSNALSTDGAGQRWIGGSVLYVSEEAAQ